MRETCWFFLKINESSPCRTPLTLSPKLSTGLLKNLTIYRSIKGSLQYLTLTRPDISFHVNQLSQFLHEPTDIHLQDAKQVLRYIKGTKNIGLRFTPSNKSINTLVGYFDSDWATNLDDRVSITGYYIWYICWKCGSMYGQQINKIL